MGDPLILLIIMWLSLTAYTLLAGADFGAGVLDLIAGGDERGAPRRRLIEHVIGPVWEANHVWLIFVLVLLWTAFSSVFAAIASTLYIPLTLVALGIIGRGSAFAFRKAAVSLPARRAFGATFAVSSLLTPYFLGASAGAIASGRVPTGIASGSVVDSWLTPTSTLCGLLAVSACTFLAAVYLAGDPDADTALARYFLRCGFGFGLLTGALSLTGVLVVRADAPVLADRLLDGDALGMVVLSAVSGVAAVALLALRRPIVARIAAGLAVASVIWGWGLAQYPQLLPGASVTATAAPAATLRATTLVVLIGLVLLLPAMALLLRLFSGSAAPTRSLR